MATAGHDMIETDRVGSNARRRFVNWRLSFAWLAISVISALAFILLQRRGFSPLLALISLYGVVAAILIACGLAVTPESLTTPIPLSIWTPWLPIWRLRVGISEIADVTALGTTLGYEAVGLTTPDRKIGVLFSSRERRLAFFDAIRTHKPDIRIYRA